MNKKANFRSFCPYRDPSSAVSIVSRTRFCVSHADIMPHGACFGGENAGIISAWDTLGSGRDAILRESFVTVKSRAAVLGRSGAYHKVKLSEKEGRI